MKAVIYARFSTDRQTETSIEDQERRCRRFAESRDLQVVDVYSDAAVSGSHVQRPGLQRLLAEARGRRFKVVVVDDLQRLSRDEIGPIQLARELEDSGVVIWDVATGMRSDDPNAVMFMMMSGFAGSQQIKASGYATWRGLEGLALGGYHTGGRAYGYSSAPVVVGRDVHHRTTIDRDQAAVVRRVFERAAAGSSPREIAHALNADGVAAPHDGGKGFKSGSGWGHTTIRAMLRNKRYLGEVRWNTTQWKKKGLERHRRRRVDRPESEHVIKQHPELVIVDQATFDRVQRRYAARKPGAGPTTPRAVRARHALAGLLTCGVCNGTFGVVYSRKTNTGSTRYLGCVAAKDRGPAVCSNRATITLPRVIRGVAAQLRDRLSRADRVEVFVAAFKQRWDEMQAKGSPTRELESKVERQRAAVGGVLQNMAVAPGSRALAAALAVEERALADLEAQLEGARAARPKVLPHPAAIAKYVANLADALEGDDVAAAGDLLRERLAPFVMHPQADGCYRLVGAINLGGPSDLSCSGGVLRDGSDGWLPLELQAA